jgi:hypothetical protein
VIRLTAGQSTEILDLLFTPSLNPLIYGYSNRFIVENLDNQSAVTAGKFNPESPIDFS